MDLLLPGEEFESNGEEFAHRETLEPVNPPAEGQNWGVISHT